ncbi:MAG: hypothetical protein HRT65_09100 [Flavobacteriaceae bacterium]|nr:hypothetical protein [Flavobacteriaceae bacterium]
MSFHPTRLFVLLTLLGLGTLTAQHSMGYRLQVGDEFKITQRATQQMTQTLEGTSHVLNNDLEGRFTFKVRAVEDGVHTIVMTFDDFAIKSTSSMQGEVLNVRASEKIEGDIMSTIFNALIGHELILKMDRQGAILETSGSDGLITKMIAAANITDEFTMVMMRKSLEKEFGSGLAQSFEQMTFFHPPKAVTIGDTWQTRYEGKIDAENEWTLEQVANGTTAISGTAKATMQNQDDSLSLTLEGNLETMIQAKESNGFMTKMMVKGEFSGTSVMNQLGSVEIPTTLNQTITYELITE